MLHCSILTWFKYNVVVLPLFHDLPHHHFKERIECHCLFSYSKLPIHFRVIGTVAHHRIAVHSFALHSQTTVLWWLSLIWFTVLCNQVLGWTHSASLKLQLFSTAQHASWPLLVLCDLNDVWFSEEWKVSEFVEFNFIWSVIFVSHIFKCLSDVMHILWCHSWSNID